MSSPHVECRGEVGNDLPRALEVCYQWRDIIRSPLDVDFSCRMIHRNSAITSRFTSSIGRVAV